MARRSLASMRSAGRTGTSARSAGRTSGIVAVSPNPYGDMGIGEGWALNRIHPRFFGSGSVWIGSLFDASGQQGASLGHA
jgi:hypothetical protein